MFELRAGPWVQGELSVVSFEGTESLSGLFSFDVVFVSPLPWVELEPSIFCQSATLSMATPHGPPRVVQGIVSELEIVGARVRDDEPVREYRLRIVPRLWLLRHRKTSRIFQEMTLVDVVGAVLGEAGVAYRWATARPFPRRQYCLQYEETDYDFVTRICAEDGVFFYFQPPSSLLGDAAGAIVGEATSIAGAVGGPLGSAVAGAAGALDLVETVVFANGAAAYLPIAGDGVAADLASEAVGAAVDALSSAASQASPLLGNAVAAVHVPAPSVPYVERRDAQRGEDEAVHAFSWSAALRPNRTLLRDYDFMRPMTTFIGRATVETAGAAIGALGSLPSAMAASAAGAASSRSGAGIAGAIGSALEGAIAPALEPPLEIYDHRGDYEEPDAANAIAAMHLEQHRATTSTGRGESNCRRLAVGYRFQLADHREADLNREYVLTEVRHVGRVVEASSFAGAEAARRIETAYENRFLCAPAEVAVRPPRPPLRTQQVLETARVTGPDGEDVHTDKYGRIKVQFHWDQSGRGNEYSSCWIRVAQAWAGTGWGFQFIPRVGMEVLVSFVGGDVDRPMVVGAVYNGSHPVPYPLPLQKTRSGIRTQSTPHGDGYNEIAFEDLAGKESIVLRAQRELLEEIGHDHKTRVVNEQHLEVGAKQQILVGGSRGDVVGGDESRSVKGAQNLVVGGDRVEEIGGAKEEKVKTRVSRSTQDEITKIDGNRTIKVKGSSTTTIGQEKANTYSVLNVEGKHSLRSSEGTMIESDDSILLKVGDTTVKIDKDGVTIRAKTIKIDAAKSVSVSGQGPAIKLDEEATVTADKISLLSKAGSLTLDKDTAHVDGPKVLVTADPSAPAKSDDKQDAPTKKVKVRLSDPSLQPYKDKTYVLSTQGFRVRATTDGDGFVEQDVPKDAMVAHVTLWTDTYPTGATMKTVVNLTPIGPVTTTIGAVKRLRSLGYAPGPDPEGDDLDPKTSSAIIQFQADHDLPTSGKLDSKTTAKLKEVYGS